MDEECSECLAVHFQSEKHNTKNIFDDYGNQIKVKTFTKCCQNGQVKLPEMKKFPELLENLMKKM